MCDAQEAVSSSSTVTDLASTCCWSTGTEIPSMLTATSAPALPLLTPPAPWTVWGAAGSWGQEEMKGCSSEKMQHEYWERWSMTLPTWVYSGREGEVVWRVPWLMLVLHPLQQQSLQAKVSHQEQFQSSWQLKNKRANTHNVSDELCIEYKPVKTSHKIFPKSQKLSVWEEKSVTYLFMPLVRKSQRPRGSGEEYRFTGLGEPGFSCSHENLFQRPGGCTLVIRGEKINLSP